MYCSFQIWLDLIYVCLTTTFCILYRYDMQFIKLENIMYSFDIPQ